MEFCILECRRFVAPDPGGAVKRIVRNHEFDFYIDGARTVTFDGRVYPAVVDGRVKWIVDGYTTSDAYPYSQMTDLGSATKDSTTVSSATVSSLGSQ